MDKICTFLTMYPYIFRGSSLKELLKKPEPHLYLPVLIKINKSIQKKYQIKPGNIFYSRIPPSIKNHFLQLYKTYKVGRMCFC
jgi:hypothetical protein